MQANAGDKEKVSLVLLAAGQLLAYVQGHLGLSLPSKSGSNHIQTAPVIQLNHIGVEATGQVMEITRRALGDKESDEPQEE